MICHTQKSTPSAKPTSTPRASTQKLMSGATNVPAAISPADHLQTLGAPSAAPRADCRSVSSYLIRSLAVRAVHTNPGSSRWCSPKASMIRSFGMALP